MRRHLTERFNVTAIRRDAVDRAITLTGNRPGINDALAVGRPVDQMASHIRIVRIFRVRHLHRVPRQLPRLAGHRRNDTDRPLLGLAVKALESQRLLVRREFGEPHDHQARQERVQASNNLYLASQEIMPFEVVGRHWRGIIPLRVVSCLSIGGKRGPTHDAFRLEVPTRFAGSEIDLQETIPVRIVGGSHVGDKPITVGTPPERTVSGMERSLELLRLLALHRPSGQPFRRCHEAPSNRPA